MEKGYIDAGLLTPDLNFESVLNMPSISKQDIAGLARTFSMYVKFSKVRWPEIGLAEKDTNEGNGVLKKLGKEFLERFF